MQNKTTRYHFSAPASDQQIAEWAAAQHSFSTSIRMLIKDCIAKYGMEDVTCRSMMIADDVTVTTGPQGELIATIREPVPVQSHQVAAKPEKQEQTVKAEPIVQTENKTVEPEQKTDAPKQNDDVGAMLESMLI